MFRVAVLASGEGTNFQALYDGCACGYIDAEIACVLSNKPFAGVLSRAERIGVEGVFVEPRGTNSREEYDALMTDVLREFEVDLVCSAGYMRLLSAEFVRTFENRVLNVHPSLLPAFPGLHAIRQAWEWGARVTGVTVHFVDAELDHGPIILQRAIQIRESDTEEALESRIHVAEYALYPKALKLVTEGRVKLNGRRATITQDVEPPPWTGGLPPGLEDTGGKVRRLPRV